MFSKHTKALNRIFDWRVSIIEYTLIDSSDRELLCSAFVCFLRQFTSASAQEICAMQTSPQLEIIQVFLEKGNNYFAANIRKLNTNCVEMQENLSKIKKFKERK